MIVGDPADVAAAKEFYNTPVLGMSPDWYRTPNYRRRLVRWPREVLAEFGLHFGPDVEVRVHDSNQKSRFMVMPMRPEGTEGWTEEQLAAIVRGADTSRLNLTPQSAGLYAISLGLSRNFSNDHEMLKHGMVMYEALYAWCKDGQKESHNWPPKM